MGVTILIPHLQTKLICHNLSMTGCFFPASDLGPVGETFFLVIDPPEIGLISVEARIVHKGEDGKGSGFQFISMDPGDEQKLSFFLDIFKN
jgi:hypothetical protein